MQDNNHTSIYGGEWTECYPLVVHFQESTYFDWHGSSAIMQMKHCISGKREKSPYFGQIYFNNNNNYYYYNEHN